MFGPRYFGTRYFGPRYFGDGSDTPPEGVPDIVLTARPAGSRQATSERTTRLSTGRRGNRFSTGKR